MDSQVGTEREGEQQQITIKSSLLKLPLDLLLNYYDGQKQGMEYISIVKHYMAILFHLL